MRHQDLKLFNGYPIVFENKNPRGQNYPLSIKHTMSNEETVGRIICDHFGPRYQPYEMRQVLEKSGPDEPKGDEIQKGNIELRKCKICKMFWESSHGSGEYGASSCPGENHITK